MNSDRTNRRARTDTFRDVSEPRKLSPLLTIVVIDVVGSTALARRLGDLAYADLIEDFRAAVRSCVANSDGREYAHTGDGFIHFHDCPLDAIEGARAVFRKNDLLNRTRRRAIVLRGGIHCGRLVRSATGPIGVALNEACEIGQNADPGELWLSPTAGEALPLHAAGRSETVELPKSGRYEIHKLALGPEVERDHPTWTRSPAA